MKKVMAMPLVILRFLLISFCIFMPMSMIYALEKVSSYEGTFRQTWATMFGDHAESASLQIDDIIIQSDIPYDQSEMNYLINIRPGSSVTLHDIDAMYARLSQKKRYKAIKIDLLNESPTINKLQITCDTGWIFKAVTIQGVYTHKQDFLTLYRQQPGEFFNEAIHESSVTAIKDFLNHRGFFNHAIKETLYYSKKDKSIEVLLAITFHDRFSVKKNIVTCDPETPLEADEIKKKLDVLLLNKYYDKQKITRALDRIKKQLLRDGYLYPSIQLTYKINKKNRSVTLTCTIHQGTQYIFNLQDGATITRDHIINNITAENSPRWLFNPDIITEQLIHDYYKEGFWNTSITYQKYDHQCIFAINEGRPTIIGDLAITHEQNLLHKTTDLTRLYQNIIGKRFSDRTIKHLIQQIQAYYIEQGYWNVSIDGPFYEQLHDNNIYRARFVVKEGLRYLWGGYTILENSDPVLHSKFKKFPPFIDQQQGFNYQWIQNQQEFIDSYYQKNGYWYARTNLQLTPLSTQNPLNNSIYMKAVWHISPGTQIKFGKTILQTTSRIPVNRIMNEVSFQEGALWNRKDIETTRSKLKRLDIFKRVQMQPDTMQPSSETKNVILILSEDDLLEIRARFGYFSTSKNFAFKRATTPLIGAGCIIRNPTNRADRLLFDLDWTRFEKKYLVEYQQPSPFLIPCLSKIKLYGHHYIHPLSIVSGEAAYQAGQYGILINLSKEYHPHYFGQITIGNEWIKTDRVRGFLNINPCLIERLIPYFFIEPSIIIDHRDDQINAESGYLGFYSMKLVIPEHRGHAYATFLTEQSIFAPVYKDIVILAARIRIGHIFRKYFTEIMPSERFYLGGPNSVRGYESETLPPLGITEKDMSGNIINEYVAHNDYHLRRSPHYKEYTIQGGSSMFNMNLELRINLIGSISTVIFHDIGILSQSGFTDFKETLFPTSGFGVRYQTPIGTIRFDIGWKWKKLLKEETSYAWYLTIGQAF